MELVSLKDVRTEDKVALLRELELDSDGIFVVDSKGEKILDRYLEEPVRVENMLLFPGSIIVLDDNPLSIASYLEEFPDAF